jgi:hypothetical protein
MVTNKLQLLENENARLSLRLRELKPTVKENESLKRRVQSLEVALVRSYVEFIGLQRQLDSFAQEILQTVDELELELP